MNVDSVPARVRQEKPYALTVLREVLPRHYEQLRRVLLGSSVLTFDVSSISAAGEPDQSQVVGFALRRLQRLYAVAGSDAAQDATTSDIVVALCTEAFRDMLSVQRFVDVADADTALAVNAVATAVRDCAGAVMSLMPGGQIVELF